MKPLGAWIGQGLVLGAGLFAHRQLGTVIQTQLVVCKGEVRQVLDRLLPLASNARLGATATSTVQPFGTRATTATVPTTPTSTTPVTDFTCNQPWRNLIVRSDGSVLPCCSFYGYEMPVGNIQKTSLSKIFNSPRMKKLRADFKDGIYRDPTCQTCSKSFWRC